MRLQALDEDTGGGWGMGRGGGGTIGITALFERQTWCRTLDPKPETLSLQHRGS